MTGDHDDISLATERYERRLSEEIGGLRLELVTESGKLRAELTSESGKLRAEMASESGKLRAEMASEFGRVRTEMAHGFGQLRAEMIDRNAALLRWGLVFGVTQTAAIAGIVALLR